MEIGWIFFSSSVKNGNFLGGREISWGFIGCVGGRLSLGWGSDATPRGCGFFFRILYARFKNINSNLPLIFKTKKMYKS